MKYYVGVTWDKRPVVYSTWQNHHIKRDKRTLSDVATSKACSNWCLSTMDDATVYKHRVRAIDRLW